MEEFYGMLVVKLGHLHLWLCIGMASWLVCRLVRQPEKLAIRLEHDTLDFQTNALASPSHDVLCHTIVHSTSNGPNWSYDE